jgi:hypothetical protein
MIEAGQKWMSWPGIQDLGNRLREPILADSVNRNDADNGTRHLIK